MSKIFSAYHVLQLYANILKKQTHPTLNRSINNWHFESKSLISLQRMFFLLNSTQKMKIYLAETKTSELICAVQYECSCSLNSALLYMFYIPRHVVRRLKIQQENHSLFRFEFIELLTNKTVYSLKLKKGNGKMMDA